MPEILKRAKPLAVNPLKASQPIGAALAFLGLRRAIPMLHGSQGCTAFGKVFLVRHFREPIPLQTTAMDQVSSIMSADENVIEGLRVLCEKSRPEIIGLPTTGLSETQGCDMPRLVREFRSRYPEFASTAVVPVSTPDYSGCLESGFALAVEAIIDTLLPAGLGPAPAAVRSRQVNVLASSMLTPGDIEAIKEWIEAFGLQPVVLPDLGDSLDGHLIDQESTPLTLGGTPKAAIAALGEATATIVIGRSLYKAADLLRARIGVPDFRFDHLLGLDACDAFILTLAEISGQPVPAAIERQRAQLQDAMVDTHFMTGFLRIGIAADPDLLVALGQFLTAVGGEIVAAVASTRAEVLADLPSACVRIGDLEDLERAALAQRAQLIVANSHAVPSAQRLQVPLLRAGFPQYDWVGGYARTWVGYRGARQALFDIANLFLGSHHDIPVHRSIYRVGDDVDAPARAPSGAGLAHH
ncbi:MAG: nitrogenase iron-molybdenum cofactor biosynthesis protein NifN [Candidatus Accumulibacter phosphatis]|uniref:Nitrogenase iron-molybdenum cofactor biosynthesis protein NifN n=1 Tax=Candidatus Accumulibacter phosphatis TaxID=327160 RepID=A0A5S4F2H6_9PROT|nr:MULTISPECIES: nitrogenase iron-molybdenum cofactor biosynthesis protein NifN [Candidatus Accumulibacter]MBL8401098.1 nitrogenase iron-molybdenum cofactor biosynthesis protein NifN [Accumulibacter sp.]MBN8519631.1 nitrogenase iron-molybdenum cofactor biosynthesis protein NifN [Accumulibacter sp.]MBO3709237.1 nitrogenase iron-molybdenum cofactor biosynthesis protein NifN [Accumulibacter sp.]MCC2866392.1 nitrogenase iron-molybdenum cofactor biosynthesis protein NifN [Candidatus Accumulibacter p